MGQIDGNGNEFNYCMDDKGKVYIVYNWRTFMESRPGRYFTVISEQEYNNRKEGQ